MTKKFWKDWQKRVGETEMIYLHYPNTRHYYSLFYSTVSEITFIKFEGEYVNIGLKTKETVVAKSGIHYHVKNDVRKYHRKDIATVSFYKLP